jgi:hypothetical protein
MVCTKSIFVAETHSLLILMIGGFITGNICLDGSLFGWFVQYSTWHHILLSSHMQKWRLEHCPRYVEYLHKVGNFLCSLLKTGSLAGGFYLSKLCYILRSHYTWHPFSLSCSSTHAIFLSGMDYHDISGLLVISLQLYDCCKLAGICKVLSIDRLMFCTGLSIDEFSREKLVATAAELVEEKEVAYSCISE